MSTTKQAKIIITIEGGLDIDYSKKSHDEIEKQVLAQLNEILIKRNPSLSLLKEKLKDDPIGAKLNIEHSHLQQTIEILC